MLDEELRPWLPYEKRRSEPPASKNTPGPAAERFEPAHPLNLPSPTIPASQPTGARRHVMFSAPPIADLTRLTRHLISFAVIYAAADMVRHLFGFLFVIKEPQGFEDVPVVLIVIFVVFVVLWVLSGLISGILALIWYYKSASNLHLLSEGGYRYSPGLTLGLLFVPVFDIYWIWRVLTRQADALMRCKDARTLDPGGIVAVRGLISASLACTILAIVLSTFAWLTSSGNDTGPTLSGVTWSFILFALGLTSMFLQLRCIWHISQAMRDILWRR